MKRRVLALAMASLLAVCLMGCGDSASADVESAEIYPKGIENYINIEGIKSPPKTIMNTTGEENGLSGEMYRIVGVVEEVYTDEESEAGMGYFVVDTKSGEIAIMDITKSMEDSGSYLGITKEKLSPYFLPPSVGETVCVYAEYAGFSDVFDMATCFYGGSEYMATISEIVSTTANNNAQNSTPGEEKQNEEPDDKTTNETPAEPYKPDPGIAIQSGVRRICSSYKSTDVSNITVNENLGTEEEGDYVLLVHLTWNVKNHEDTTKEMLAMYSEDFAARVGSDLQDVSEMSVFWTVPYYSETEEIVKYSYSRQGSGMYQTDVMISNIL